MSHLQLAPESRVRLHPLFRRLDEDDPDGYIVGRVATSVYIAMPSIGMEALELLEQGHSLGETKDELLARHDVPVDVAELVEDLVSCGFVHSVDGQVLETAHQVRSHLFSDLKQEHVAWLFSRPAITLYSFITLITIGLLITPDYRPHQSDFFFHPFYTVNTLSLFVVGWAVAVLHELWHLLAAKAQGLGATIRISQRLYWIVAETDVSDVYMLPRCRRYVIYLAGMLGDVVFIFLCLLLRIASDREIINLPDTLVGFLRALTWVQLVGIAWQFAIFVRTDVYYVLATLLGCKNLLGDTQAYLGHWITRIIPWVKDKDLDEIPRNELRVVRVYMVVYLAGLLFAIWLLFSAILPVTVQMFGESLRALSQGYDSDSSAFLDGLVIIGLTGFNFGLLAYTLVRNRLERH